MGAMIDLSILHVLQLALTAAPSDSEIFLFTDASAKDTNLKGPVIALMERTQTVVRGCPGDV